MTMSRAYDYDRDAVETGWGSDDLPWGRDLLATGALAALVLVAVTGFVRVYAGTTWAPPVLMTVAAASAASFAARRVGLRSLAGACCGVLGTWVLSSEIALGTTTQAGLPLLSTLKAASGASQQAAAAFISSRTPVHALAGFVLWTAWGAGLAAVAADWLAFRTRSLAAIFPPFLVFIASSVLGVQAGRGWAVESFIAAAVLFALSHQWAWTAVPARGLRRTAVGSPASSAAPRRKVSFVRTWWSSPFGAGGVVLASAALLAGLACAPFLAREGSGVVPWRQSLNLPVRVTPDPLVSLRNDLSENSRMPMFVVHSTQAAYWRLMSLQNFDGTNWTGSGSYERVQGAVSQSPVRAVTRQVQETFDIERLASPWLPVAFQPVTVSASASASYDPVSASLITSKPTSDGEVYRVVAVEEPGAYSPSRAAARAQPLTAETHDPGAVPATAEGHAGERRPPSRRLVGRARNEYEKALALQDFFHRPPFIYALNAPDDSRGNALTSFLFRPRWVIASSTPRPTQC